MGVEAGNVTGLADRVPVPVLVVDRDGVVVRSNDAAREYLGDAASVGADVTAVIADVDSDSVEALLRVGDIEREGVPGRDAFDRDALGRDVTGTGASGTDSGDDEVGREQRVRFDVDEHTRRPMVRATPVADGVELVVDTVAERNRYGELVESVGDPMYILDETGHITAVNDALVETYGYGREDLVGSHATMVMPEDAFERGTRKIVEILDGETETETETLEFSAVRADGTEGWAEANLGVLTDDDGTYSGSVGVIRDVTDRKHRARELADFETIVETAPVGMFTVDEEGTLTWANRRLHERLGMGKDELIGRPFYELVEEGFVEPEMAERYAEYLNEMLSSETDVERVQHEEVLHPPSEDEPMIVDAYTTLLPLDEDERFTGTVNAFRDITQRKAYREALERQNERLEAFASFVSHDLRNPLNIASGYLDMAQERHPDDDALDEVEYSMDRMRELVGDLLTLARQGDDIGETELVSLADVAERAWSSVETEDATLNVQTSAFAECDETRLRQVFENLFRNSIEHGDAGADGNADSSGGDTTAITVRVGETDDGFFVADAGVGIPTDIDLFEVGETTNEEGTGLGLRIVEEIVDAHGWEIWTGESDGGGARFDISGVPLEFPMGESESVATSKSE